MSRRLLVVNAVYPPARGATGVLLQELCRYLAREGWAIEVVTGPSGVEPRVSRGEATVFRTSGSVLDDPGAMPRRVRHVLGSSVRLLALAARRARRRPDVVLTLSDPPLGFLAGPALGRIAQAPVAHWCHDVYPDIAVALGVLEDGRAASVLRRRAGRALAAHDAVVSIGRDMADRLSRLAPSARIEVVPNWPLEAVAPDPAGAARFRADHDLEDRFLVIHAGAVGLAHPVEAILGAAGRMSDIDPRAVFLFVGDGTRWAALEAEIERRALSNVRLLPFQPRETLSPMLSAADVHLVSMAPDVEGMLVPSKTYGAMAAGRPVVVLGPASSEAARFVLAHGAGRVIPHDAASLLDVLRDYASNSLEADAAGGRGRDAVTGVRSRSLRRLADLLTRLADRPISQAG